MKLNLNDLQPRKFDLELSAKPGKKYALMPFSLYVQAWVQRTFGDEIQGIFENQKIVQISQIAHFMLEDKSDFPDVEDLQKCIITVADRVALMQALLETIGISKPIVDKLLAEGKATHPKTKAK